MSDERVQTKLEKCLLYLKGGSVRCFSHSEILLQLSNMLRAMSTVKQLLEFLLKHTRLGPPVILYPFPLPLPVRAVLILRSKSPLSLNMR
jgi:hypothetical protein